MRVSSLVHPRPGGIFDHDLLLRKFADGSVAPEDLQKMLPCGSKYAEEVG
jgi:hypothetical protein